VFGNPGLDLIFKGEMMKTTQQWLHEVKTVPGKLQQWLERQYVGEVLAAQRIQLLAASQADPKRYKVLSKIALDEFAHADWIAQLLKARNIPLPVPTMEDTRYWEPILGNLHTFEEIAGAGHHAETMRLSRITALANDKELAPGICAVFARILPDEVFHAEAFKSLSTPAAIAVTLKLHQEGLDVLGLVA
jgi:rubrerythrin